MNFYGKLKVFVDSHSSNGKEYNTYNGCITKKNDDGTYTSAYIRVAFAKKDGKEITLEKNFIHEIIVTDGFITCDSYTNKEKKQVAYLKLVVSDFVETNKKECKEAK